MNINSRGVLTLENGMKFEGDIFGDKKSVVGETVFLTSMVGYQESITDPSYAGQILVMTYPLIGNYGINFDREEAKKLSLSAVVVGEKCSMPNSILSEMNFEGYLRQNKVTGLCNVDTRALALTIREYGSVRGVISSAETQEEKIKEMLEGFDDSNLIEKVSTKNKHYIPRKNKDIRKIGIKVVVIDLGVKKSIISELIKRECEIVILPYDTDYQSIMDENPDLVLISNGPGDPKYAGKTIETIEKLLGRINICGICMGHQIIALAIGAETVKLKFGHRGCNHPVKDLRTNKLYITSQNHNYYVSNLPKKHIDVTFISMNDKTVEGFCSHKYKIKSVQFHPEASPGPKDANFVFDEFLNI